MVRCLPLARILLALAVASGAMAQVTPPPTDTTNGYFLNGTVVTPCPVDTFDSTPPDGPTTFASCTPCATGTNTNGTVANFGFCRFLNAGFRIVSSTVTPCASGTCNPAITLPPLSATSFTRCATCGTPTCPAPSTRFIDIRITQDAACPRPLTPVVPVAGTNPCSTTCTFNCAPKADLNDCDFPAGRTEPHTRFWPESPCNSTTPAATVNALNADRVGSCNMKRCYRGLNWGRENQITKAISRAVLARVVAGGPVGVNIPIRSDNHLVISTPDPNRARFFFKFAQVYSYRALTIKILVTRRRFVNSLPVEETLTITKAIPAGVSNLSGSYRPNLVDARADGVSTSVTRGIDRITRIRAYVDTTSTSARNQMFVSNWHFDQCQNA